MFSSIIFFLLSSALFAASPLETDFPDGYWDRELAAHGGRMATVYSLVLAVDDPVKARAGVEAALKAAGGKLTSFSDQTAAVAGVDYSQGVRMRPAYTLGYQFEKEKGGVVARKLVGAGRLVTYNMQSPYQVVPKKDIEERVDWIEKEKARSSEALKSMPVSRAMLESRLKRLKAALETLKATEGFETVSVQLVREDPDAGKQPSVKP